MCSKADHESREGPFLPRIALGLPGVTHVEQPSHRSRRLGHLTTFGGGEGGWEGNRGWVVGRGGEGRGRESGKVRGDDTENSVL